jgi:hypothetical protein
VVHDRIRLHQEHVMLNLPIPDDARRPAVSERDFAELHRDRDGAPCPKAPPACTSASMT